MLIIGIILFGLLVVVHELGHFIAAKRSGVEVQEFGIGFPPRLFSRRFGKDKTLYSFNLIPLGGFVKLKGESNADTRPHSFGATRLRTKAIILLAGVGMNVVAVYVIILALSLTGLPEILPNQFTVKSDERAKFEQVIVAQTEPDSAAAKAGLKTGDDLLSLNREPIINGENLRSLTAENAGKTVELRYKRNGKIESQNVSLGNNEKEGYLGVAPVDITKTRYSWSAPIVAAGVTMQMLWLTLSAIVGLIGRFIVSGGGQAGEAVTGPVGVFFLLQNVGNFGFDFLLLLIASISASLAVINGLPIPALDGGRLALIALSGVFGKRLSSKLENTIHGIGFVVLIALVVVISYFDVKRFF